MSDSKVNDEPKNPRNAARNAALAELQAKHRDEYEAFYEAECLKRGLVYKVRLTAEERAERDRAEALAKAQAQVAALAEVWGEAVLPPLNTEPPSHLTEPVF